MSRPSNVTAENAAAGLNEKSPNHHSHTSLDIMQLPRTAEVEVTYSATIAAGDKRYGVTQATDAPLIDVRDPFEMIAFDGGLPVVREGGVYRIGAAAEMVFLDDLTFVTRENTLSASSVSVSCVGPTKILGDVETQKLMISYSCPNVSNTVEIPSGVAAEREYASLDTTVFAEGRIPLVSSASAELQLSKTSGITYVNLLSDMKVDLVYRFEIQKLV